MAFVSYGFVLVRVRVRFDRTAVKKAPWYAWWGGVYRTFYFDGTGMTNSGTDWSV
jgi:hypothetical protein